MFKQKEGGGGSKAFWKMLKKTALFWNEGIPKEEKSTLIDCFVLLAESNEIAFSFVETDFQKQNQLEERFKLTLSFDWMKHFLDDHNGQCWMKGSWETFLLRNATKESHNEITSSFGRTSSPIPDKVSPNLSTKQSPLTY